MLNWNNNQLHAYYFIPFGKYHNSIRFIYFQQRLEFAIFYPINLYFILQTIKLFLSSLSFHSPNTSLQIIHIYFQFNNKINNNMVKYTLKQSSVEYELDVVSSQQWIKVYLNDKIEGKQYYKCYTPQLESTVHRFINGYRPNVEKQKKNQISFQELYEILMMVQNQQNKEGQKKRHLVVGRNGKLTIYGDNPEKQIIIKLEDGNKKINLHLDSNSQQLLEQIANLEQQLNGLRYKQMEFNQRAAKKLQKELYKIKQPLQKAIVEKALCEQSGNKLEEQKLKAFFLMSLAQDKPKFIQTYGTFVRNIAIKPTWGYFVFNQMIPYQEGFIFKIKIWNRKDFNFNIIIGVVDYQLVKKQEKDKYFHSSGGAVSLQISPNHISLYKPSGLSYQTTTIDIDKQLQKAIESIGFTIQVFIGRSTGRISWEGKIFKNGLSQEGIDFIKNRQKLLLPYVQLFQPYDTVQYLMD